MELLDILSGDSKRKTRIDCHFNRITPEEDSILIAKFSEDEITNVIQDYNSLKALRPNDFNFSFLKEMQEVVKKDICEFVANFHKHDRLVKGLNPSFIVLIPMKENSTRIKDFKPISIIGCMYQVITKLLANRLRLVMKGIISECQSTFMEGRQLVDSVVVVNETIEDVKRRKRRCIFFKVDSKKALLTRFLGLFRLSNVQDGI